MIFNAIEDLESFSIAEKLPISQQQIITYGLNVLNVQENLTPISINGTTWYQKKPLGTILNFFYKSIE